ncbi:MAG TPA: cell division topological specificity factor MinE [Polyangiaceae bacterium]|nr:cell division topological specificity factor MinE [Polyangiaceae bacterium]
MAFLDYFRKSSSRSASVAKDRLSIIVAREHGRARGQLDYLPQLKQELLQVLAKYERIDLEQVTVNLERNGDCEVLELNVVLSEAEPARASMPFVGAALPR